MTLNKLTPIRPPTVFKITSSISADVLGDLLVGVPADVVGRLMQLCQLLYRDVHRAASFLSETRSRTMENRTAATTT